MIPDQVIISSSVEPANANPLSCDPCPPPLFPINVATFVTLCVPYKKLILTLLSVELKCILNIILKEVPVNPYLGVMISNNLKWNVHIAYQQHLQQGKLHLGICKKKYLELPHPDQKSSISHLTTRPLKTN